MQQADQADIQLHVAIQDMTEFVCDNALQLLTAQFLDRTAGDTDDCIAGLVAGRESIDTVFFEQVYRRYRSS